MTAERTVQDVIEKYTSALWERNIYETKSDELLGTIVYEYEKPPLIEINGINLKLAIL